MKKLISIPLVTIAWILGAAVLADDRLPASGDFSASIFFPTISLTPVGTNCLLQVDGELEFAGTLQGVATGTTRALVLGSCADVAATPPGTFRDFFRSSLVFAGMVNGEPLIADITYQGRTEAGGQIKAVMLLSNGAKGVLQVNAIVVVGGTYEGFVKLEHFGSP